MAPSATQNALNAALCKLKQLYGHRSNVTAFDIGFRWKDNRPTDALCVRVHVDEKIAPEDLATDQRFVERIDGVAVDVIAASYRAHLQEVDDSQPSPSYLVSGSACSRLDAPGGGTVGAIVVDKRSGAPGILSNWHVLFGPNGKPGDRIVSRAGAVTGNIGILERGELGEAGDAAFARFDGPARWLPAVKELGIALTGARRSRLGEVLVKFGRATGLTRARVDGEGLYRVAYRGPNGEVETRDIKGIKLAPLPTTGQAEGAISAPGDSGSVWIGAEDGEAVGLNFAGEGGIGSDNYALACDVTTVLHALDLRLASLADAINADINGPTGQVSVVKPSGLPTLFAVTEAACDAEAEEAPKARRVRQCGVKIARPSPLRDPRDEIAANRSWTDHGLNGDPRTRRPEHPGFGIFVSFESDIWPELETVCRSVFPTLRGLDLAPDSQLHQVIGTGDLPSALRDAIRSSLRFNGDGAIPSLSDLAHARRFRDVCHCIGRAYRELGYALRP